MNMTVNNGSNVTFNCVSFSYVSVIYTWLKNGVILLDDGVIISTDNDEDNDIYTTTLMILNVQLSDNGVYVCNATNREDTTLSNAATLSIISKLLQSMKISCLPSTLVTSQPVQIPTDKHLCQNILKCTCLLNVL